MPSASLLSSSRFPLSSLFSRPNSPLTPSTRRISNPNISSPRFHPFSTRSRDRTVASCSPMSGAADEAVAVENSMPQDSLSYARAYWVTRNLIAWNASDDQTVWLYASRTANLFLNDSGIEGQDEKIQLQPEPCGLPSSVVQTFPHIKHYRTFHVPCTVDVGMLLKCQLAVASFCVNGKCKSATGLQLPGVLDDIFAYTGPLGAVFTEEAITLYLSAPTAQMVCVHVYRDAFGGEQLDSVHLVELCGVWSTIGPRSWEGCYYVYEISVYHPNTSKIETCTVNDPYARGLSSNGMWTLLVNLDSEKLKPVGWEELANEKPSFNSFSDISIYELHIQDFSASDQTVNPDLRGGYLAFTSQVIVTFPTRARLDTPTLPIPVAEFMNDGDEELWHIIVVTDIRFTEVESIAKRLEDFYMVNYSRSVKTEVFASRVLHLNAARYGYNMRRCKKVTTEEQEELKLVKGKRHILIKEEEEDSKWAGKRLKQNINPRQISPLSEDCILVSYFDLKKGEFLKSSQPRHLNAALKAKNDAYEAGDREGFKFIKEFFQRPDDFQVIYHHYV